jgi:hypothetical protein
MGHQVKVRFGEEWVEGEELDFEPLKEGWNEYRCSDGSYVRLKTVVSKITRLEKQNPQGEPIYVVASSNVVAATPPPSATGT